MRSQHSRHDPLTLAAIVLAAVALALSLWISVGRNAPTEAIRPAAPVDGGKPLRMAACTGRLDSTPGDDPWVIPLTDCDAALDDIDVKAGVLSKLTVCGGADSFSISLAPRTVTVTGSHYHCSSSKSEAVVIYLGTSKR